jgi:hypothetical protein
MAVAMQWSTTVMLISLEMVMPGLAGYWLDQKLGTHVVFLLVGFALGGTLATLALALIAKKRTGSDGGHVGHSNHDRLE